MLGLEHLELLHKGLVRGKVGLHAGNWARALAPEPSAPDLQEPGGVVAAAPAVLLEPGLGERRRRQGAALEVRDILDMLEDSLADAGQPFVAPWMGVIELALPLSGRLERLGPFSWRRGQLELEVPKVVGAPDDHMDSLTLTN